jgi:hypothetical protein
VVVGGFANVSEVYIGSIFEVEVEGSVERRHRTGIGAAPEPVKVMSCESQTKPF